MGEKGRLSSGLEEMEEILQLLSQGEQEVYFDAKTQQNNYTVNTSGVCNTTNKIELWIF